MKSILTSFSLRVGGKGTQFHGLVPLLQINGYQLEFEPTC
jgi:hypothetical protein